MSLHMIFGCMFSGKSTELLKRIRDAEAEEEPKRILKIVHAYESQRYKDGIVTHNQDKTDALSLEFLRDIPDSGSFDIVFIEEAQFFTDLYDVVSRLVNIDKKEVHVCGLDDDFMARPFTEMLRLLPISDTVVKLAGSCAVCGNRATFSKRLNSSEQVLVIGGAEMYQCVCRQHFYT